MSEKLTSTVYGIAPWSAELLQISGDIDRGRKSIKDYSLQYSADFGIYSGVLEAAGIDFRAGDWGGGTDDYLRDIGRLFGRVGKPSETGPVTRWFDTNTFYRQPDIEGFVEQSEHYPHEQYLDWLELNKSAAIYQPTFLSPYSLAKLSAQESGTSEVNALNFAKFAIENLIATSREQGVGHILLHEPFIPYIGGSSEERLKFIEALEEIIVLHTDMDIGLFFSYGDASPVINDVLGRDLAVAVVGCDLQKTPLAKIGPVGKRRFLAGLVDGANTLFHSDQALIAQLLEVTTAQKDAEISLTHTVDLEHVPRRFAIQKIMQIGRVVSAVNEIRGDKHE
ncbi:MAG TPA: hypothetical protein VFX86_00010 [Candidatus Saccharimonadales bacterium]|nr:hypothetical protein [Candidatus Saccharimonadales bacterium]